MVSSRHVVLMAVLMTSLWLLDAVFDTMFAHEGTFRDLVALKVPLHDILFRLLIIVVTVGFFLAYRKVELRRHAAQGELQRHLAAIESSMDGIALFNEAHEYLYTNDAYARTAGFRSPTDLVGRSFSVIYDEHQIAWITENIFPVLERGERWHGELPAHRKDGSVFLQEATISMLPDRTCICVMRDITERRKQEVALRESERFLSNIFDSIHDPFCILDQNYRIVRANEAYADLKDRSVDDLIEQTCYVVLEGRTVICEGCVIQKTLQSGDPCAKEKKVTTKSGEALWLEIFTYPLKDENGEVTHVIEYTRDVTDRRKSEEERRRLIDRLDTLSKTDGLTGLANRRALEEHLSYEIDRARRYDAPLSIILCDMDNLKEINDVHGHQAGDMAIQFTAATIRNALRASDIAGRYGGDEFLLIVPQTTRDGAQSIAEKIRTLTQKTRIQLEGDKQVGLSVSMGIAVLGAPPDNADSIVSRVDKALYDSKQAGRNRITLSE
jgi:diguanylate cyclase (GGDEF)-like protein/PAS domain S-box-containing protein